MSRGHGLPLSILLVEDNPDHAELVRRGLAELLPAAELTVLQDGEEALAYLFGRDRWAAERPPRPRLILLDLRLPRLDGIEVLRQIKAAEELRRIPTVVLTTSEAETDLGRAYANHANSYLVKPVDFERFVRMMRSLDEYWLEWNHQPLVP